MRSKFMKSLLTIGIFVFVSIANGQSATVQPDKEAERLWELAVEAKGGRERLLGVQNMVVSSSGKSSFQSKSNGINLEDLYVLPNKQWTWNDERPSHFGVIMSMYNWENRTEYTVTDKSPKFSGLVTMSANVQNSDNLSSLVFDLLLTSV